MNRVDGKVALVTGGGSGIGQASSMLLATGGAKIVVTDIDEASARKTEEAILQQGGEAISVQHDVTSEADWDRVVAETTDAFGKLNVLVNNAGVSGAGSGAFEELSMDQWKLEIGRAHV